MMAPTTRSIRIFVAICVLAVLLSSIHVPLGVSGDQPQSGNAEAAFGNITVTDTTITYDRPRNQTQFFEETIEITVENTGNTELVLDSIFTSTDARGLHVTPSSVPEAIPAHSNRTIILLVAADPNLPEGDYPLMIQLRAADENIPDASLTTSLTITHDTVVQFFSEFSESPDEINLGEWPVGMAIRFDITVRERLGYQDIEDIKIERQEGPKQWLTLVDAPGRIEAGSTETVTLELQFDPRVAVYEELVWQYTVNGSTIESQTIQIRAIAIPYGWDGCTRGTDNPFSFTPSTPNSTEVVVLLDEIDSIGDTFYNGPVDGSEAVHARNFCAAASNYVGAAGRVETLIAEGEYDRAHRGTAIAAAKLEQMNQFGEQVENKKYREHVEPTLEQSQTYLNELIADQVRYHRERLSSENTSLLERAKSKRSLADFARYQGDLERARELDNDAEALTERYRAHIADGEQSLRAANRLWMKTESNLLVTVGDRLVLLNPLTYRTFAHRKAHLQANYSAAEEAFDAVDEADRADRVATVRRERLQKFRRARRGTITVAVISSYLCLGMLLLIRRRRKL